MIIKWQILSACMAAVLALAGCGTEQISSGNSALTTPSIPSDTGVLLDPSLSRQEFDRALADLGLDYDDLLRQDTYFTDLKIDTEFVSPGSIVGEPEPVSLSRGRVIADGIVVVHFSEEPHGCRKPVGGSATVQGDTVQVRLFMGRGAAAADTPCPESQALWRASLLVAEAEANMQIAGHDGRLLPREATPPLWQNLPTALIHPGRLPRVGG